MCNRVLKFGLSNAKRRQKKNCDTPDPNSYCRFGEGKPYSRHAYNRFTLNKRDIVRVFFHFG